MKWMTKKEIKARGATSKEALRGSVKHWYQLSHAWFFTLRIAIRNRKVGIWIKNCSLCVHYKGPNKIDCTSCPADIEGFSCCKDLWFEAAKAFDLFAACNTPLRYWKFHCAARKVWEFLEGLT